MTTTTNRSNNVTGFEIVDGKVSFASRRIPAWNALGTTFNEDKSTREIMDLAYLSDWNVRAHSYNSLMPENWDTHMNKVMIIRDNPFYDEFEAVVNEDYDQKPINLLGDAGANYEIMQNEELFEFGALFGKRWETAGSVKNGTVVFGTLAMETEVIVDEQGANDEVKMYLMLMNSHNGSTAMRCGMTPLRIECMNTLNFALHKGLQSAITIRHTRSMRERLEAAKKTAEFAVKYVEKFGEDAKELYEVPVSEQKFWEIVNVMEPRPEKDRKGAVAKWTNKVDGIMEVWNGKTCENIKGTGWGALNALTEDQQWNRRIHSGNLENFFAAGSGFDDAANKDRNKARSVVREMVLS